MVSGRTKADERDRLHTPAERDNILLSFYLCFLCLSVLLLSLSRCLTAHLSLSLSLRTRSTSYTQGTRQHAGLACSGGFKLALLRETDEMRVDLELYHSGES